MSCDVGKATEGLGRAQTNLAKLLLAKALFLKRAFFC